MTSHEFTPGATKALAVSVLSCVLNPVVMASIALALFMEPMTRELGWSHGDIGAGMTFAYWGVALGAALAGRFVDRFGARMLIVPLAIVSGLLLAALGLMPAELGLFYAMLLLLGISVPGAIGYSTLLSGWFLRRRALAMSGLGVGIFLCTILIPPLAHYLRELVGWRGGFLTLGLAAAAILFPASLFFARARTAPAAEVAVADALDDGIPAIATAAIVSSRTFSLLVFMQLGSKLVYTAFIVHAVGILTRAGLSPAAAAVGLSAVGIGGLAAQIGTGWLVDRFDSPYILLPLAGAALLGAILIHSGAGSGIVLAGAILLGMGCGAEDSVLSYLLTRYFGVRSFPRAYGVMMPLILAASAPAPLLVGLLFDRTGSYALALIAMELSLAVGILCLALLRPFPASNRALRDPAWLQDPIG